MNDDEINDIVARTEEEMVIFRQMDQERADREEREWRAAGNTGPVPPRLMTIDELPEIYQRDEPLKGDEDVEVLFAGRGARARNTVKYTDGLTDDQWAEALEEGTLDEPQTERKARIKARPPPNRIESSPEIEEPGADDDDWGNNNSAPSSKKGPPKRGRGRPRNPSPVGGNNKRKRGGGASKQPSPSPSLDDEDDVPESKRRKTATAKGGDGIPAQVRERMKKAFQECYRVVQACTADDGRSRCDLFRELPNRKVSPMSYMFT